jgi:hypothetical protein
MTNYLNMLCAVFDTFQATDISRPEAEIAFLQADIQR